jgi:hypothetical protein
MQEILHAMDVACIDQNTAAVTSPVDEFIQLVDVNTGETVKCIKTDAICSGITSTNGHSMVPLISQHTTSVRFELV